MIGNQVHTEVTGNHKRYGVHNHLVYKTEISGAIVSANNFS
jgi:hypothetical protein